MSILQVGSSYPPGITGNPYSPWDIGIPFDMNWDGNSGVMAMGFTAPGISGLGQAACATAVCDDFADDGSCIEYDDSSCIQPVTNTGPAPTGGVTDSATACGTGWSLAVNSAGQPICTQNDPTSPTTPTTDYTDSATACGSGWSLAVNSAGQPICTQNDGTTTPLNTPLTPAQAGLTTAQQAQLIAATGNAAVSLIRTAEGGPYTVAGTNLIYNPATGALTTAAATNATATLTAGLSAITPYIPYIIAAVAAIAILPSLLGGKR